jgi:hypothetical protein
LHNAGRLGRARILALEALNLAKQADNTDEKIIMFSSVILQCFLKEKQHTCEIIQKVKLVLRDGREALEDVDLVRVVIPAKRQLMKPESRGLAAQTKNAMKRLFRITETILSIYGDDEDYEALVTVWT